MKSVLVALSFLLLVGCAGRADLSQYLRGVDPILYSTDFAPNINYRESAKAINLARSSLRKGSSAYNRFSNTVHVINEEIIDYVVDRFDLPDRERARIRKSYFKNRGQISDKYYNELTALLKTTEYLPRSNEVVTYDVYPSVSAYGQVLSGNICTLFSFLVSALSPTPALAIGSSLLAIPCEVIMAEAVNPIVSKLENAGLLIDNVNCIVEIKSHARKFIMQMATVNDVIEVKLTNNYSRDVLWGLFTSQAQMETTIRADVKAGFDLAKYFEIEINEYSNSVNVFLPEPEVLSIDMIPRISKMDDGYFIKIDENHITESLKLARQRIYNTAVRSNLLQNAQKNAEHVVEMLFTPFAKNGSLNMDVNVYFKKQQKTRKKKG